MTNAKLGYGAKILMGDGATPTEVFTLLGEIGDFDEGITADTLEVTNHSSPNGFKEYIASLKDHDEVQFEINYEHDSPTQDETTGIRSKIGQTVNFRFEEPDNPNGYQKACIITKVGKTFPVENVMKLPVTLKPTGDITTYVVT